MEYAALIRQILAAERAAQEITREGRAREAGMDAELAEAAEKERRECFAWADRRLEQLRRETGERQAAALKEQDARLCEAMEKMEEAYRLYGDVWVDILFRQTVEQRG